MEDLVADVDTKQYLDVVNLDKVLMVSSQVDKDLAVVVQEKVAIIVRVVAALDNKQVVMVFQPIFLEQKLIMQVVVELLTNLEVSVEVDKVESTQEGNQEPQILVEAAADLVILGHKVDQETLSMEMDNRLQDLGDLVLLFSEFPTYIRQLSLLV